MEMTAQRKQYNGEVKARVAIEAIKGARTVNEIASAYGVHPVQVAKWKKQAMEALPRVLSRRRAESVKSEEELKSRLYQEIGQLKVELDWLKKNLSCGIEERRRWIEPAHPRICLKRQCALLGLARASGYYAPVPECAEDLRLKRWIDAQYTKAPFYGIRRMTAWLRQEKREGVNHKRVARRMREMGLEAIYPKPRVSRPGAERIIYPYLLRALPIVRPNQVWGADITDIRLAQGFI
jgi:putative transposase